MRTGCRRPIVMVLAGAALVCATLTGVAAADDTAVGGMGGGVHPLESTDIRMVSETVEAIVYGRFAEYRATFLFENQGEQQNVRLGFPFAAMKDRIEGLPYTSATGFRAWQDGRPLEVIPQLLHPNSDDEYDTDGYFLHEALFPSGRTKITVSYLARPLSSAGDRLHGDDVPPDLRGWIASYDYWLHTGAGWRGTIGKAVVQYRFADTFLGTGIDITRDEVEFTFPHQLTEPPGYERPDEATVRWVFEDFEAEIPTYPLRVLVNEDSYVEGVADLLRDMGEVLEVEILSADEVAREWDSLGPEDPRTYYEDYPPRTRVDAVLDSYADLRTVERRLLERFPENLIWFDREGEEDPYPYDVVLAFSNPWYDFDREGPLGPRISGVRTAGAAQDEQGTVDLISLPVDSSVVFELEETPEIREVRVVSGDLGRLDGFERKGRPKAVELGFSNGTVRRLDLEDRRGVQRFPVQAPGGEVELRVLDSYPGTVSGDEVAIWEIEFATEPAPEFAQFEELIAVGTKEGRSSEGAEGHAGSTTTEAGAGPPSTAPTPSTDGDHADADSGAEPDDDGGVGVIALLGGLGAILVGGAAFYAGRRRNGTEARDKPE